MTEAVSDEAIQKFHEGFVELCESAGLRAAYLIDVSSNQVITGGMECVTKYLDECMSTHAAMMRSTYQAQAGRA